MEPGSCPALQGMVGCEWAANRLSFLSLAWAVIYNELCHSILKENWLNPYIWYLGVFIKDWEKIGFLCPLYTGILKKITVETLTCWVIAVPDKQRCLKFSVALAESQSWVRWEPTSQAVFSSSFAVFSENLCGFFCWSCPFRQSNLLHSRKSESTDFCGEKKRKWNGWLRKISVKCSLSFFYSES